MMRILTINTGSSSVRLALFEKTPCGLDKLLSQKHKINSISPESLVMAFIQDEMADLSVISHRVVHGGTHFISPCLIDEKVAHEVDRLSPLAPLHNPIALNWIKECGKIFNIPQVAVFDTAFFAGLPDVASAYAIPRSLSQKHGIRRYGFHGLAHQAMLRRWQKLHPELADGGRIISLQLGSGCSITAIKDGTAIDTSMGFSPLEGLMMATRPGDVDPGIIIYLQRTGGLALDEIEHVLNSSSGLLGVSGVSADMRVLLETDTPHAQQAIALYCYRAKKYIGAYLAALGGAEAIVFGGGVGENAPVIRGLILQDMEWVGIKLDHRANSTVIGKEGCISSPDSKVAVWVLPVDESIILAREALTVI